jgi:hypothetical protein
MATGGGWKTGGSFADRGGDFVDIDLSTLLKVALSLSKGKARAKNEGQV